MLIARAIPIYSKFVRAGETADLFHGFAPVGDELLCAFRRHRIVGANEWHNPPDSYESSVMLQKFDLRAGALAGEPELVMAAGEDPRCIALAGRPYIFSANPPTEKFNYILYDVAARRQINIEVENVPHFKYGKNWQPFVYRDKLFVVHGFAPFRILHIDPATGKASVVFEKDVGLDAVSPHDGYTHFRGGASALVMGDEIIGYAHFTVDTCRHIPFQWRFSPARESLTVSYDLGAESFTALGLNIIDPTCFFRFREKLYLGLSCSNRDWFYGQSFASLLLELSEEAQNSGASLAGVLSDKNGLPPVERGTASPSVFFFRAAHLKIANGSIGRNFEVVSYKARHDAGNVLYGPYVDLPAGKYEARLQYASPAFNWEEVGHLEVCANSGAVQMGKRYFRGTTGRLMIAALEFEIVNAAQGRSLETKVYSSAVSDLNLTDIAIVRVS